MVKAKGKTVIDSGFKEVEEAFDKYMNIRQKKDDDSPVIAVSEGETLKEISVKSEEHFTTPLKPYTEEIHCYRRKWITPRRKNDVRRV